jgi:exosome complex RNA-binding protein Rrp4
MPKLSRPGSARHPEAFLTAFGLQVAAGAAIVTSMAEKFRWRMFSKVQAKRRQYLESGDVVEARIRTGDGVVDPGVQRNRVVEEVP